MIRNIRIDFFKENYLVISLFCYGIGLITTYCKFFLFKVPIWYYLSITDLLLYPLIQVATVILIMLLYVIFYRRLVRYIIVGCFRRHNKQRKIKKYAMSIPALTILVLIKIFDDELVGSDLLILLYILPIGFLLSDMFYNKRSPQLVNFGRRIILIYAIIIVISLVVNSQYKLYTNKDIISFTYNDSIQIKTINSKFYIGETSSHLIIYDTLTRMSEVYKKEHIDNLRYYSKIGSPKKVPRRPTHHR